MLEKPWLSSTTTLSLCPSCTEVAISDDIIRKEPSPTTTYTSRDGSAILDAEAARDLVAHARVAVLEVVAAGWRVRHSLWRSPGRLPAAHTNDVARSRCAFSTPITSAWLMGGP